MSRGLHCGRMIRFLVAAALMITAGCRKSAAEDQSVPQHAAAESPTEPAVHTADAIASAAAADVAITEALVSQYLRYRGLVVERGRIAVEGFRQTTQRRRADPTAISVQSARATEEFTVRMRAIEETARAEVGLTREQVAAVGQVVGEVLSARQLWRMSGGDQVLQKARAELASLPLARRRAAERALARNEQGFSEMRDARSARKRFGDAAVDAVLAQEDALWKVQQDGARVMAEVY